MYQDPNGLSTDYLKKLDNWRNVKEPNRNSNEIPFIAVDNYISCCRFITRKNITSEINF